MIKKTTFILFITSCILPRLQAQSFIRDVNIELIGPEQGLPDRNTRCIIQDKLGFLWLGTRTGLYRYDGYNFENYTHLLVERTHEIYTVVNEIKIDNKGRLWVAHDNGLAVVDPMLLSSKKIDLNKYFPGNMALTSFIRIYFDSGNNAWAFGSGGLLVKLNTDIVPLLVYRCHSNPVTYTSDLDISMFHDDKKENLYLYMGGNNLEVISKTGVFKKMLFLPAVESDGINYQPKFVFEKTDSSVTLVCENNKSRKSVSVEYNLNKRSIGNSKKNSRLFFFLSIFFPISVVTYGIITSMK